ncbi:MAG: hypothetical protein Q8M07_10120, partial [Prosthecobacter sp.]|nr:hypothetical protein [Prosthecobacter sp.]
MKGELLDMSVTATRITVFSAVIFTLGGALCMGSWYHSRFTRFPVHRLPSWQVFESWRVARTRQDILAATQAVESFYARYHRLPFNSPKREYQFSITLGHELNGVHPNSDRSNADSMVFWDVPAGEQRDGWGNLSHYY